MSRYSDLIRVEREFNYSINIQFDMENDRQLLRFIPNSTTIQLFKEFFIDITKDNPANHSRILYGSYGTGKSHFLTVLSILLEKRFVNSIAYQRFLQRIKAQDESLAYDIDSYVSNRERKPLLTVPIVFDFEDFNRCIYFSLRKRLEQIGKKVSFRTFFDQALGLIEQWNSKEESRISLERACDRLNLKVDDVVGMLKRLDSNSETVFQAIFSEMTYGVKYIYEATNVSDAIRQANSKIADDYSGIVFIFDEFGRYIEDNLKQIKVKSVQDLAEFCDHGDGDNHIILVSHKEISQYTQRVSRSIANEWKKVEGRFKATPINDKQDQCLSLIKSILTKDDGTWDSFKKKFRCQLDSIAADTVDFQEVLADSYIDDNPIEAGYPLHPISLFVLDRLSKKVAQNERTFFTYLASQDEHSLYSFLGSHDLEEFSFVGLDDIFDYFEESIKAVQSDESFDWYKKLQSALSKVRMPQDSQSPLVRILKAIAVSIVSIIVNCIQWSKEKKRAKNASICDELKQKLQSFYYPYLLLEKENTELYKLFANEEKKNDASFKTLVYLLNGRKDDFSENDKSILSIIIENDGKLRKLINDNGQYIDSDALRKDLSDMAVHYQLIEMAYAGSIKEVNGSEVYSKHVYPRDIQTKLEAEKKKLEERIKELQPGGKKE